MDIYNPTLQELREYEMLDQVAAKSPRRDGPVLMADCTTPLAGESLLAVLWKRWENQD
ncbi:hypothetical protein [Marivita sp.]|uniref:hypothetical protein n=1 Tax=Marivita sp. TaxID=2003365 RepID=UPI003F6D06AE